MNKEQLIELGVLVFMSIVVGFVVGAAGLTTVVYLLTGISSLQLSFIYASVVGLAYLVKGLFVQFKK